MTPTRPTTQAAARARLSLDSANFYAAAEAANHCDAEPEAVHHALGPYLAAQNDALAAARVAIDTAEWAAIRRAHIDAGTDPAAVEAAVPGSWQGAPAFVLRSKVAAAKAAAEATRRRLAYVNARARAERARMRARRPPRSVCFVRPDVSQGRQAPRRRTPRRAVRLAAQATAGPSDPAPSDEPPGSRVTDLPLGGAP